MEGEFPSNVLWVWRKGRVPMETPSLSLLTRAPTAQGAWGCLFYLGTPFYFFTSGTTLGSFSFHYTRAPGNFAQSQSFPIFQKQSLLELRAGNEGASFLRPPFFLPSAYPDPHPLSQISFSSLGSFPTISQRHESQSQAVTTTALGGPASPGATVCIHQER